MKKLVIYLFGFLFLAATSSCIKDKFDAPPAGGTDPNLKVNFSIDSVKARYDGTHANYQFNEDLIISAIVVGDDKAGNLYKQLAVEDSTGGIMLMLSASNLYNNFPVGRRLFVKLKGMYVVNYNGTYQLCSYINPDGSFGGVPSSLFNKFIAPGKWGLPVVPKVVTINQLNDSYQSELIELDGVEFISSDMHKPYADGYNLASYARTIKDCNGGTVEIYTSGYAGFANVLTPTGNGKLLAIYGTYNGTPQLIVRDTTDVQLSGITCNGNVHPSGNGIGAIRALYTGSSVTLPTGTTITGTVISDKDNANLNSKNLVVQDTGAGIVIRFSSAHTFALGDVVSVDVSGATLAPFNGWLQISTVPNASAVKTGTGTVTPRVATINQINQNAAAWESTLVTMNNTTMSGGSTYSGNVTLNDGTGNAVMYTATSATFASTALPTGAHKITAILGQYNGVQMVIRNTSDVQ